MNLRGWRTVIFTMELFANEWCVVFAPQTVSRSAKPPDSLVSGPHCNYKKAKEHTIITKSVTIINYVQPCSITLCRQMPTNPEMYEML